MLPDYIRKLYVMFDDMYSRGIITDYTYQLITSSLDNYY